MSKKDKRKRGLGRYLKAIPSADLIKASPELQERHRKLVDMGFTLKATLRPYRAVKGHVTMRLVWRRREPDIAFTITEVVRVQSPS